MRYTFLIASFLGLCSWLSAQLALEKSFFWEEETTFTWEGEQFLKMAFAGAVPTEKSQVLLPQWIEQFPLPSNGDIQIEILDAAYENFSPNPRFNLQDVLAERLQFQTSVSRSPQGWIGKISCIPLLRTNSGYQRLQSIRLRITHQRKAIARTSFTDRSVLADGEIYQLAVTETGIHKLSRNFLRDALGISNLDNIDPRSIRLYGQKGGMLPEVATDEVIDDLQEYPILIEGEADGRFDAEDALIFYGEGATVWTYDENNNSFSQAPNLYDNKNYYYIKIGAAGNGLRVATVTENGGTVVNSFDDRYRFEKEAANPLHTINTASGSGQIWLGDFFKNSRERIYNNLFTIPDLVAGEAAQVSARMGLRSGPISANSHFFVEIDGQELRSNLGGGVNYNSVLQSRALNLTSLTGSVNLAASQVNVKVSYPVPANAFASEAWLDYVQIVARRQLRLAASQLLFRDTRSRENTNISWQLSNATASTRIWRLSPSGPVQLGGSLANNLLTVGCATNGQVQEMVAFQAEGQLLEAEAIGPVSNQNLHSITQAEMLIVSHPSFLQHAETLAEHRRTFSGLAVVVATTDAIYHEFSSGKDDPAAIRNFAKMLHERDSRFRYLLLVGDGSFDHRNIYELGSNFIPVFEHQGTFNEVSDFPADDFYGIFTASSNRQPLDPDLNISVGRLPVRSSDQAREVVAKIVGYDKNPAALGNWRNRMVFVGDDEDGGQHTRDVDGIARSLEAVKPELNFDKLYFDLFPQITTSAGDRYPDVTEGLNRSVVRGSLAITYLGHGGPRGWAQERVLSIPQIRNWRNPDQLPIFITATCTFASFDDAAFVSAGEETLLSSRGGAVALLTTTRPVFATQNRILTERTTAAMLERPDGQWRTLGDVILIAKNAITTRGSQGNLSGNTQNARKFTLLGDPATIVALPIHDIRTTMINQQAVDTSRIDTIGALDQITISGEVVDVVDGNILSNFNGLVYPTVFDKAKTITTLQQDAGSPAIDVRVQQNIIFRGRATVTNGRFSFTFVVPRDIDYQFGQGKISYYAADPTSRTDASGFYDQIIVGGTSRRENTDNQGPEIEIFLNNETFVSGDEVEKEATLILKLRDDSGINITGNSIGHDLEAVIDEDTRNTILLNDYYEAKPDDFQSGEVRYPLFDLEPGLRTLRIRAWDVANNSSIAETQFLVVSDAAQTITHLLNYPNPFTDFTCFQFDHTLLNQDVEALIQIYTVSGRLVKTIRRNLLFSDGSLRQDDCIEWNGADDYEGQLARGVYLYQVRLKGEEKTIDSDFQKLVILK